MIAGLDQARPGGDQDVGGNVGIGKNGRRGRDPWIELPLDIRRFISARMLYELRSAAVDDLQGSRLVVDYLRLGGGRPKRRHPERRKGRILPISRGQIMLLLLLRFLSLLSAACVLLPLNQPLEVDDVFLLGLDNGAKFQVLCLDKSPALQEQFMEPAPQAEGDKGCAVEMQDRNMEPPGFRERLDVASHVLQTYMLRNVIAQRMQDHTPVRASSGVGQKSPLNRLQRKHA